MRQNVNSDSERISYHWLSLESSTDLMKLFLKQDSSRAIQHMVIRLMTFMLKTRWKMF